jgi:type III pantothenate kinase
VDIGTCVKFDFLDKENCYLGGSISPGARLRFQSLHDYTARLPLLEIQRFEDLVGNSSQNAIYAGVMTGMRAEILQMIEMYEQQFGEIQVYLTGGDCVYFDMGKKNNIFATENLTLVGIFQLFKQNASFL